MENVLLVLSVLQIERSKITKSAMRLILKLTAIGSFAFVIFVSVFYILFSDCVTFA